MKDQDMKSPDTKKRGQPRRRAAFWLALLVFVAFAAGALALLLPVSDPDEFVVTFYELRENKLQGDVRIVFLSDLHLHEFGQDNERLVDAVRGLAPDLIAIGGDMNIEDDPDYEPVLTLVKELMTIGDVYYALGNHEFNAYLFEDSKLPEELKALGAHVLSNRYETIELNGNKIDIGGLNEMSNHFEEYSQKFYQSFMKSENYRLLLAHDPAYFDKGGPLVGEEIDLALCGHRHGGQVVIPFVGGLYHPGSGLLPDLTSGAHDVSGTWVVVSRGLGNPSRIPRVNNPPELVVIDLY